MQKPIVAALSLLLAGSWLGCKSESNTNTNTNTQNSPSAPPSSEPLSAPAPNPALPPSDVQLQNLFAGPPDEPNRPVLPLKLGEVTSGVSAILPSDWTGGDIYGDDLMMAGPGTEAVVLFRYEALSAPRDTKESPEQTPDTVRNGMAFAAKVRQIVWEAPVAGTVGEKQARAFIWRGKGIFVGGGQIAWNVYALAVYLSPDTKVNIVGTWNSARPSLEKAVISAIKSVRR